MICKKLFSLFRCFIVDCVHVCVLGCVQETPLWPVFLSCSYPRAKEVWSPGLEHPL